MLLSIAFVLSCGLVLSGLSGGGLFMSKRCRSHAQRLAKRLRHYQRVAMVTGCPLGFLLTYGRHWTEEESKANWESYSQTGAFTKKLIL